jgi:hypothetical protein
VVLHHLVGLLRLRVAGLLHPAANRGVRRVSGSSDLSPGRWSLSRAVPTPRRIPLDISRTLSPGPLHFLTFTRRAARASRVRVAAPALLRASRVELAFKALLCRRVRTTCRRFRQPMAYPPVGFLIPSKILRSTTSGFRR